MVSEHQTVLLEETVAAVATDPHGIYVDGTFGRGGHSRLLLDRLAADARLIGIDKDPQAIAAGRELAARDARFVIAQGSFADMPRLLAELGVTQPLTGILLDLGVSSPQLDQAERGFSFSKDGFLDMRMDPATGQSAAQWLAVADEQDIAWVLKTYGEERFAKRIARAIVAERAERPIETTLRLAKIVADANPAWEKGKNPATRAFQAIRIQVNDELGDLTRFLDQSLDLLAVGGRLAVISFHSLEDRLVKRFIKQQARGEADDVPSYIPLTASMSAPRLRSIGRAIQPGAAETDANPRARSAILRVAEKLA